MRVRRRRGSYPLNTVCGTAGVESQLDYARGSTAPESFGVWLDLAVGQCIYSSPTAPAAFTFALALRLSIFQSFVLKLRKFLPAGLDLVPNLTTVRTGRSWAAVSKVQGVLRASCRSIRVYTRRPKTAGKRHSRLARF